jgi:hypothetical protein
MCNYPVHIVSEASKHCAYKLPTRTDRDTCSLYGQARQGEYKSKENTGQGRSREGRAVFSTHGPLPRSLNERINVTDPWHQLERNDGLHGPNAGCGPCRIHPSAIVFIQFKSHKCKVEKRANPKLCAVSSSLLYSWVKYFRHESPCSNLPGTIALYREKQFFLLTKP